MGIFVIALHIGIITLGWKIGLVAFERIIRLIPQQNKRILLYFFMSTGIIVPFYFSSINISLTILFLFSFSLPLLYDLYLEGKYSHVTWTLTWILFLTAFHTQLLYKFTLEREWAEMKIISEKLSTTSDKILEKELKKIDNADDKREQLKELSIDQLFSCFCGNEPNTKAFITMSDIEDMNNASRKFPMSDECFFVFDGYDYAYDVVWR
jgi:hypothetical protein